MSRSSLHSHGLQQAFRPAHALGLGHALERGHKLQVFQNAQHREKVEGLKDEAQVPQPELRELIRRRGGNLQPGDADRAGVRRVDRADEIEQSCLAGSRRAHRRRELAFLDRQVQLGERVHRDVSRGRFSKRR